jgi:FkbM family methyltransferase
MTRIATLKIADGVRVVVPDSLNLITPYVLFEQQDWFEDEIRFLRRILRAGQHAIDIGANYGVYTLTMAHAVGPRGGVWAFEPASTTADFLRQGIEANGFGQVTLIRGALSNTVGAARLSTSEHAELNALEQAGSNAGDGEMVPVMTLDGAMAQHDWSNMDFLKIDAEGEESRIIEGGREFFSRCSPLVMYEVKAGTSLHLGLVREFAALGYESYRLVPGLDLLAPFETSERTDDFLLNLFCCKQDRAASLAQAGFLVERAARRTGGVSAVRPPPAGKVEGNSSERLAALPYAVSLSAAWRSTSRTTRRADIESALDAYLSSQERGMNAADRLFALETAFASLSRLCAEGSDHLQWASLARVAAELGERAVAVNALAQLQRVYAARRQPDTGEPFLAVTRRFDSVEPVDDIDRWLQASLLEGMEKLGAYSSYFTGNATLKRLEAIDALGYGSEEMSRRLQLVRLRFPAPGG